jgi:methylmalonyl-CoA/ethylmalonyl-CoA epimerase
MTPPSLPQLDGPVQLGFVVPDARAAARDWHAAYGLGPWTIFTVRPEAPEIEGRAEPYAMRVAVCQWGAVQMELLEPVDGPTDYVRSLEAHGGRPHLHHVKSAYQGELEDVSAALEARGQEAILRGHVPGASTFVYLRPEQDLGCILELTRLADPFTFPEIEEIYPPPDA